VLRTLIALLITMLSLTGILAQDDSVTVPDLTGLNVPQAAAELNRTGLQLGAELGALWTPEQPAPLGTIGAQSLDPGSTAAVGTPIDITILSTANITLLYDDNDITLVNQTGANLNLTALTFNSGDGTKQFLAAEWQSQLETGDCGQLWSVTTRREPKRLPECGSTRWLGTNDTTKHFWTALAGVTEFTVSIDGVPRVTCPAAPAGTDPLSCNFFLGSVAQDLDSPYLHFSYTADQLAIINTTADRWMPFTTPIRDAADQLVTLNDPARLTESLTVGDITRLAPGQCLVLTTNAEGSAPDCHVLATAVIKPNEAFWSSGFQIDSQTDDEREPRQCPPADAARPTVCIMPR
jgi:hypothetical protein